MRKIKFRGLSVETKEWIFGSLLIMNDKYYIHSSDHGDLDDVDFGGGFEEVIKESVGQFIDKQDKNGKDEYEGDIVQDSAGYKCLIVFKGGGFCFESNNLYNNSCLHILWSDEENWTIIGNIHENSELLE